MARIRQREFRVTDPTEAAFLAQVEVRLVLPTELARCEREVCENHQSLWRVLHEQVPESRNVHGLRHKQATVLTIVFA